jgi:hypothetical protein
MADNAAGELTTSSIVKMGANSRAPGKLDVDVFLSKKQGGKIRFGTNLIPAVLGIWEFCIASRFFSPSVCVMRSLLNRTLELSRYRDRQI